MKKPKLSLGQNDLRILNEVYSIDLSRPASIQEFQSRMLIDMQTLYELDRSIYVGMNPHRKKRIPNGQKCSFCFKSENEVFGMAKHESGFNLCNKCIKIVQKAEND
jgi:hypothetical protein